jgi:hypothetical protein
MKEILEFVKSFYEHVEFTCIQRLWIQMRIGYITKQKDGRDVNLRGSAKRMPAECHAGNEAY